MIPFFNEESPVTESPLSDGPSQGSDGPWDSFTGPGTESSERHVSLLSRLTRPSETGRRTTQNEEITPSWTNFGIYHPFQVLIAVGRQALGDSHARAVELANLNSPRAPPKLLGVPGIATRSKDATRGSWPYYIYRNK